MDGEKHHHNGLFHHHKDEDQKPGVGETVTSYSDTTYVSSDGYGGSGYDQGGLGGGYAEDTTTTVITADEDRPDYVKEVRQHKHKEHMGEFGAAAAGAFALYEKHQSSKDPEHEGKHRIEEEIAAAVAVGSGGYAFHEHHEKKEAHREEEGTEGKKHHFI